MGSRTLTTNFPIYPVGPTTSTLMSLGALDLYSALAAALQTKRPLRTDRCINLGCDFDMHCSYARASGASKARVNLDDESSNEGGMSLLLNAF